MSSRNRPSLSRQTSRSSGAVRNGVAIEGRCSIGGREAQTVLLTDLGPNGCRMHADAIGVTKSATIELWLGETGPIASKLEWIKDGALGVSFETEIAPELLEALYETSLLAKLVRVRK
jgi:hypothetical protein